MNTVSLKNQISKFQISLHPDDIYNMLLLFLMLGAVNVPVPVRLAFMLCHLSKKRIVRILVPVLFATAYFIGFHLESVMIVYYVVIALSIGIMEYKKPRTTENGLVLLLFSAAALSMEDFLLRHFLYGMKITYVGLEGFPACFCRIMTIFLLIGMIRILYALIGNLELCGCLVYGMYYFINTVNYWVTELTGKDFLLSDIRLAGTVAGVINNVQVQGKSILHYVLFAGLVVLFFTAFHFAYKKWCFLEKKETRRKNAVFYFMVIISFLLFIRSDMVEVLNYSGATRYGTVYNLVLNINNLKKPTHYDTFMEDIAEKESSETKEKAEETPNIIIIMNESFSDLQMAGKFDTNQDYMPFTRQLLAETPSGTAYSSVWGNNTVSSEMEVLTGIPTGLTVKGCDFYQKYCQSPKESLVSHLKDYGYRTVGLHPYNGDGYNRANAWDAFEFDETYFEEDFPEDSRRVRKYISDEAFYDKIISCYEESEEPLFAFGVSMQNHAAYRTDYDGDITLTDMDYEDVDEYLSLIHESDQALERLIQYFENADEETVILFFGDHQPLIDTDFYTDIIGKDYFKLTIDEQALTYQVPYFIWTNYETDHDVPEKTSMNYLPHILLESAGIPENAWFAFTGEVEEQFPVVTDHFAMINDKLLSKNEILKNLKVVQSLDDPLALLKEYQVWSYARLNE